MHWRCDLAALGVPAFALLAPSPPRQQHSGTQHPAPEGLPMAVRCRYRRSPEVLYCRQRDSLVAAAVSQASKRLGLTLTGVCVGLTLTGVGCGGD